MSAYNIPQEVRDSLRIEGSEQPEGTPEADPSKDTADVTGTNASGESDDDRGEGNGPSEGDLAGKDKEPTRPKEPTSVKLSDKKYGLEELDRIVKEHQDSKNWEKSNTEKSQMLSARAKAIDGVISGLEDLFRDKDALEILEDMGHKLDKEALSAVKETANMQSIPDRDKEPDNDLEEIRAELNDLRFMEALRELTARDEDHQKTLGNPEKRQAFLKFMVDNDLVDLDKAYVLYIQAEQLKEAKKALEEAKKKGEKSSPKNAPLGVGAKDIKTGFEPVRGDFGYEAARKATEKLLSTT